MLSKNPTQPLAPRGQLQTERPILLALATAIILTAASCGGDEPSDIGRCEVGLTAQVERWRELVEKHFKYQHVTWALNIITCESRGDPKAYNASSGASGLFQHLKKYWPSRATSAGFPGASAFDPEPNIAASAWLLYTSGGGPQHWSCKYSPFEDFGYTPQFYKNGVPVGPPPPPPPPCGTLPTAGGTIDEKGSCFELHGPSTYWRSVTNEGLGGHLYWTNATKQSAPSNWARWSINLSAAGKYEVFYYAVATFAVFAETRYVLHHGAQDTTLLVDQGRGGAGWRSLGVFDFSAGTGQHLSVYDNTPQTIASDQHI
ncbi:MAG: transglycosylase SLT domain-containing protein, partial [Deltaproteobacteria bacterium]|nr:transglycosylase SLT domain-containing protein [Deltaproteobacteria bacterium]